MLIFYSEYQFILLCVRFCGLTESLTAALRVCAFCRQSYSTARQRSARTLVSYGGFKPRGKSSAVIYQFWFVITNGAFGL